MVRDYVTMLYVPAAQSAARLAASDYKAAKALADWRQDVFTAWPGVAVLHVESQVEGDPELGSALQLRAEVALNGLSPAEVDVQAVYGGIDAEDRLVDVSTVSLPYAGPIDGTSRFEGDVPLERTGTFGYTVRVLPKSESACAPG